MHVHNALQQLDEIHERLTRSEVYRGFRVPSVVLVGVLAVAAAAIQTWVPDTSSGAGFIYFWVAFAAFGSVLGFAPAIHRHAAREGSFARRRTRQVMIQFLPCIVVGALTTVAALKVPSFAAFLPGLWGMTFGLGIVAARPHLPSGMGIVVFWYLMSGAAFVIRATPLDEPSGWAIGLEFGVGHLLTALVLWRDEREEHDDGI